ncbi:MAG: hypothetical protein Roseis2KO_48350 [Roseivirga sp.]
MNNKEEIIEELIGKLKGFQFKYEIREYLTIKGVDPAYHKEIIETAFSRKSSKNQKLRQVLSLVFMVVVFISFYYLIPISIYNLAPIIISIFGGLLFSACVMQVVGDFSSVDQLFDKPEKDAPIRQRIAPFVAVLGLATIFVFLYNFKGAESRELLKYGKRTRATVVDGTATTIKRGTSYSLTLRYRTQEDPKVFEVKENVSSSEYNSLGLGASVDIIYSSKNPKLIELLVTNSSIEKYLGVTYTRITIDHLFELIDLDNKKLGERLNELSFSWHYDDEGRAWINSKKELGIRVLQNKQIIYITPLDDFLTLPKELERRGFFSSDEVDPGEKVYKSAAYTVSIISGMSERRVGGISTTVSVIKRY